MPGLGNLLGLQEPPPASADGHGNVSPVLESQPFPCPTIRRFPCAVGLLQCKTLVTRMSREPGNYWENILPCCAFLSHHPMPGVYLFFSISRISFESFIFLCRE